MLTGAAGALLVGATFATAGAGSASAAPSPSPSSSSSPNPTQSTGSEPAKPPIALEPPGSAHTGPLVGIKADDGAVTVAQKWYDSRQVDITVRSPAVGSDVVVRVLVPKGWSQTASTPYPVALMLHGGGDDYTSWTRETTIEQISASRRALVVMPDACQWAAYTNFYNGGKFGPPAWETFHTVELVQILQRGLRAGTNIGVAGLSSGGYGAMNYASRNPKLFKFAASLSGAVSIRTSPMRESILGLDALYPQKVPFARFGVPYIDEKNWAANDPLTNAARLRGVSIFLSSGYTGIPSAQDTVEWSVFQVSEILAGSVTSMLDWKLKLLGIPHTVDFYALGEHAWVAWQDELEKFWPQEMKAIGATRA